MTIPSQMELSILVVPGLVLDGPGGLESLIGLRPVSFLFRLRTRNHSKHIW